MPIGGQDFDADPALGLHDIRRDWGWGWCMVRPVGRFMTYGGSEGGVWFGRWGVSSEMEGLGVVVYGKVSAGFVRDGGGGEGGEVDEGVGEHSHRVARLRRRPSPVGRRS